MKKMKNKPICPFTGLPCEHNGQCETSTFGVLGNEIVWRCPDLKKENKKLIPK